MKRYRIQTINVLVVRDPGALDSKNPHYLRDAESVAHLAHDIIPDDDREHFGLLCLNNKNRLLGYHEVSVGTLTAAMVHPREVFRAAILAGAAALILVHNHPSGEPMPSPEDQEITRRLDKCAELFGIHILDHVIIGGGSGGFFSFATAGLLNGKSR